MCRLKPVFVIPLKGGAQCHCFCASFSLFRIFSACIVKTSAQYYSTSGHQARSSDLMFKNIHTCVPATLREGSISNSQRLIRVIIHTKFASRIFNIRDLRSGQFCNLTVISQWEKFQPPLFASLFVQYNHKRVLVSHACRHM